MKSILLIGIMALVAGCGTRPATSASEGRIPRLRSNLTARDVDGVLRKGMSIAEVAEVIASVPTTSAHSASFSLADGYVLCHWKDGALEDWLTAKESKKEPVEAN